MLDKKTSEALAEALSCVGCIPSFDGAMLFSDDIANVTGFQVMCNRNTEGRMVFSVHGHVKGDMTYDESLHVFQNAYKKIHGNPIRELGKHDVNSGKYPSFGADYAKDLSPATIVRMIRVAFENVDELECILPAYVMRLTQEVKNWENHFKKLHRDAFILREKLEEILEETF